MTKAKLTLKDVAEQLGVSTATISNAFNRPDQLSQRKREEILAQCKKIGYSGPNKAAQILRKGTSNIVALVLADSISYMVSDPVASTFIKGVSSALKKQGKHLLLYAGDSSSILDVVDFVDGFICYGAPRNAALVGELALSSKPVVTVDFDIENKPSVNIDNEEAAFEVASYALNEGDNVAILGLRLINSPSTCRIYDNPLIDVESSISHRRLDGYLRAAEHKDVTISNEQIWHLPESERSFAKQAAREVLTSSPRPDVVLCMSDIIALELLHMALELGIKVPEEIKITGFDGIEEAERARPRLTTVCQSSTEKGIRAANELIEQLGENIVLPFEIRKGETVY
ncbi:LacI family DNA-binding transcriptional regulator [Alteromonas sp. D210916BOD_24]|uniref:LacI family DNA-binding transcriptional regulator n=1 Tax=Alteromonas sp. D210916BOD_24 TaxID=3157618 RepID=UPI00399CA4C4